MATDVKNDAGLSTNLVSYWELEESSGTRVDSHGSNDVSDVNTVLQGTGKQGNCADFERAAQEYLSITDAAQSGLQFTTAFSMAAWVNFESYPSGLAGIGGKLGGASNRSYCLFLDTGGTKTLRANLSGDGTAIEQELVNWTPSLATWYHVGMTYDGGAGEVKFYVDGAQQGATQTTSITSLYNNTSPFEVGNIGAALGSLSFDGLIDEFGAWSRVLTPSEFSELYNSGAGIPYDAGGGGGGPIFVPKITALI